MRTVVAYDATLPSTATVAESVAAEAGRYGSVEVGRLEAVGPALLAPMDLLIVGTPGHLQGESAAGLHRWVDTLPPTIGVAAAAFSTGVGGVSLSSESPATLILRALRARGCHVSTAAETFRTWSHGGELLAGETERAAAWAATILRRTRLWLELRPAGDGRSG